MGFEGRPLTETLELRTLLLLVEFTYHLPHPSDLILNFLTYIEME